MIDRIDKKILYELEADSRQSVSKIAKCVKQSKQVVNYRIEKMKEVQIIKAFSSIVDRQKIGLGCISMFVKLKGVSNESEEKMITQLSTLPLTGWVGKTIGRWDFLFTFLLRDVYDINIAFQTIMPCFGDSVFEHIILFDLREYRNVRKVIFDDIGKAYFCFTIGDNNRQPIDEKDYELLRLLSNNSRISVTECAKVLSLSDKTVKSKIEVLKKAKVIQGFKTELNYALLGYSFYICMFQLGDLSTDSKKELVSYLCKDKCVTTVIETPTDYINADIFVKNVQDLNSFISSVKNKFKTLIVKCDVLAVSEIYKSDFFPTIL
ncbi:AsnC family transcriptional regulator [Candidatus Bathycorpusculum sp.]|uniref:Lrp/AsnC family transcriptional regulator n=1 Tax=Candidatus Bathycorpusculum sp. TaxID=2994959 RepID=UPI0028390785|nr:AsnC family transcriptional regulator [Candidatus Termitimicrobium sp.]